MEPQLRNKLIVIGSIGIAIIAGIFIKNKIQENNFKPIPKDKVLDVLKRSKKENYSTFKQVATVACQIAAQMNLKQIDPNMIKQYLESTESPIKVVEIFQQNYKNICENIGISYNDFNRSLELLIKNGDKQVTSHVELMERDYELSLSGKVPQFKVNVPANLTKERIIEINKKILLSKLSVISEKYLIQVEMFRKLKGKTQAELSSDPSLMEGMPNPDQEQENILEQQGLGNNEEPATAVFIEANKKYRNDTNFKQTIKKVQSDYLKIFEKYRNKLQTNKMSENDLNQLEDELIYSQQI